jgi:histidyl-tRNA synthetase
VIAELEAKGIEHQQAVRCLELFHVDVTGRTIRRSAGLGPELNAANIERLRETLASHQEGLRAVEELADIMSLVARTTAGHTVVDPSLARGLSYYTGAIMEIAVPDLGGSLGGGGRYDDLIGMFLGRSVPACGFSLGLERIIVVMTERNMFPASVAPSAVDVMVTLWNDATRGDALEFALELRRAGLRVDVYPEPEKLGKQFRYAASRHAPMVAILGDDERSLGQVALKDLRTGEQRPVPRAEAAEFVKRRLHPEP